jgi:hypothetical protein
MDPNLGVWDTEIHTIIFVTFAIFILLGNSDMVAKFIKLTFKAGITPQHRQKITNMTR